MFPVPLSPRLPETITEHRSDATLASALSYQELLRHYPHLTLPRADVMATRILLLPPAWIGHDWQHSWQRLWTFYCRALRSAVIADVFYRQLATHSRVPIVHPQRYTPLSHSSWLTRNQTLLQISQISDPAIPHSAWPVVQNYIVAAAKVSA